MSNTPRSVTRVIDTVRVLEGGGFPVRRPFPTATLDHVDPFLLLDHFGPIEWGPNQAIGAPAHPHRGFETVSYILAGAMMLDYLGQKQASQDIENIVADLLFGVKNPSGKLPVSFPLVGKGFLDHVTPEQFPGAISADGKTQTVTYSEKLHMGYRWYDANISGQCAVVNGANPCLAFPFGHGLSYTSFSVAAPNFVATSSGYEISATVTNTGKTKGSEVVQVYLALPDSASAAGVVQPPKRLVGFQKVELAPGASKQVVVKVDPAASNHPLSVWNQGQKRWTIPAGQYTAFVGKSSAPKDLVQAGTFTR